MSAHDTFAADWLSLREPADHAARSVILAERLQAHFGAGEDLRVADLGCGHGSNLRWLAPRLAARQRWLLVDHDPTLLEIARSRALAEPPGPVLEVRTQRADLAESDLTFLDACDVVTASALFDLVSEHWLKRLVRACREARCAALLALSVTGEWHFFAADRTTIDDDEDIFVREQFNLHQRRDKGLGAALGPAAAAALPQVFADSGFAVEARPSDWQLSAGEHLTRQLGPPLLQGWRDAAIEQRPGAADQIRRWHERRLTELRNGQLGLHVGHIDLLALPQC